MGNTSEKSKVPINMDHPERGADGRAVDRTAQPVGCEFSTSFSTKGIMEKIAKRM